MRSRKIERRRRRSDEPLKALELQLEACRETALLDAMVLSDADGLVLAAAGDRQACDEIAVQLPVIGRRVGEFQGILLSAEHAMRVHMRRFRVGLSELYVATIGGGSNDAALERCLGGAARILA
jgi:hypothetical protein